MYVFVFFFKKKQSFSPDSIISVLSSPAPVKVYNTPNLFLLFIFFKIVLKKYDYYF